MFDPIVSSSCLSGFGRQSLLAQPPRGELSTSAGGAVLVVVAGVSASGRAVVENLTFYRKTHSRTYTRGKGATARGIVALLFPPRRSTDAELRMSVSVCSVARCAANFGRVVSKL